jgi:hypothetical protein
MQIECNQCHEWFGKPSASSFMFSFGPAGILTGVFLGLLAGILRLEGWGAFLFSGLLGFPLWLFLGWVFFELPRWRMILAFRGRRCPKCGACDWGRPFAGFGL